MAFEYQDRFVRGTTATSADRAAFIRSVYLWLTAGFGVACVGAVVALLSLPRLAGMGISGRAFIWILFFAQMGAVVFASAVSRRRPLNILLEQAVHPLSQLAALAGPFGDLTAQAAPGREISPGVAFHASAELSLQGAQLPAQLRFAVGQ